MPPTVLQALGRSARATTRSAWLAPIGLVVGVARTLLVLPAQLFAVAMLGRAAAAAALGQGLGGGLLRRVGAVEGALAAVASPRLLAIALGLWAAGALLAAALRLAWLAGALPTLGRELAGGGPGPASEHAFAPGVAWGFARLLPAAVLAFAVELAAGLASAGAFGAAVLALVSGAGRAHPVAAAILGAAALSGALLAVLSAGAIADATVARAALRGEGPGHALARGTIRFGRRPAAFLAVALAAVTVDLLLGGSARGLAVASAGGGSALVVLGPQLMASALAATLAVLVELWRIGAGAVLACHD